MKKINLILAKCKVTTVLLNRAIRISFVTYMKSQKKHTYKFEDFERENKKKIGY